MRRIVLGSVALSLVLVLAGCGLGESDDESSSSSSSSSSTTTTTGAVDTTTTTSTTTSTTPSIPASNPEEYVTALIDAWVRGDRATAETLAVASAVDTLLSYEPSEEGTDPTWAVEVCEGAAGSSYCTFSAGGDPKVIVRVMNEAASTGQPQAVSEVRVEG